jgi:hypothetical protein
MTIRTRWHKLMPLINAEQVYFTAPKGGMSTPFEDVGGNINALRQLITVMGKHVPLFVVDQSLVELSNTLDFHKSLIDMKRAGVLRLPYPAMIIEIPIPTKSYFVILRDCQDLETKFPWEGSEIEENARDAISRDIPFYGYTFEINSDESGQYIVASPNVSWVGINVGPDGNPWVKITATAADIFDPKSRLDPAMSEYQDELIRDTYMKTSGNVGRGLFVALLLMATQGVQTEVVATEKLNRKRVAAGKTPIPKHTYIRVGRVYKKDGTQDTDESEEYNPRKSPRIHWRRGHARMVRFGPGRSGSKLRFIPGRLVSIPVGIDPGDIPFPEYHVLK